MDEKDKQIKTLQKKLKFFVSYHPQTEEILVVQNKCDALKSEVLDLKSKLLNLTREKEELMKKRTVEVAPINPQPINTESSQSL